MRLIVAIALVFFNVTDSFGYDLVVSAETQNQVVSGSKSYVIPKGTSKVSLLYNILSAEFPIFVTAQSIFNDVWTLSVNGSSGELFSIERQVNSQLTQEPVWHADSTTGDLRQKIDVSALTANADATVEVVGTAMNVSDSALATVVRTSLELPPKLTIEAVTADTIETLNDGNYYSVASAGESNTLQRYFNVKLSKTSATIVNSVTVTLRGDSDLMVVANQLPVPSGNDVKVLSDNGTSMVLRVRATIANPTSTVNSSPPPARDISYFFKVLATDDNGSEISAEKLVSGKRALWQMQPGIPRYGHPDSGGDHWVARGTYNWIAANAALINEVDDVSGEHGRQIGHKTHQYGTDIDTYHFYKFSSANSGLSNYDLLRNAVILAFGTVIVGTPSQAAQTAKDQVIAFVQTTRTGLTNLASLTSVSELYYAIGNQENGLPYGWAKSLIKNGSVTRSVNGAPQTLNLGLGSWTEPKLDFNSDHNSHVHITLNRPAIGE
jgi:hypothetical protein